MRLDKEGATKTDTDDVPWCAGTVRRTTIVAGDSTARLNWEGDNAAVTETASLPSVTIGGWPRHY